MNALTDFRTLVGWAGLQWYLEAIGIRRSLEGLERRGRRHGLPHGGGIARGRLVWFERQHVDSWVRHLAGVGLDRWLEKRAGCLPGEGAEALPRLPSRIPVRRAGVLAIPQPLLVVTIPSIRCGEQPYRLATGGLLASLGVIPLEPMFQDGQIGGPWACWMYQRARPATESDLVRRPVPRRGARLATTLIGGLRRGARDRLSWWFARGEAFGLPPGTRTALLASRHLGEFPDLIADLRRDSQTTLVAWTHRARVNPVTFEQLRECESEIPGFSDW